MSNNASSNISNDCNSSPWDGEQSIPGYVGIHNAMQTPVSHSAPLTMLPESVPTDRQPRKFSWEAVSQNLYNISQTPPALQDSISQSPGILLSSCPSSTMSGHVQRLSFLTSNESPISGEVLRGLANDSYMLLYQQRSPTVAEMYGQDNYVRFLAFTDGSAPLFSPHNTEWTRSITTEDQPKLGAPFDENAFGKARRDDLTLSQSMEESTTGQNIVQWGAQRYGMVDAEPYRAPENSFQHTVQHPSRRGLYTKQPSVVASPSPTLHITRPSQTHEFVFYSPDRENKQTAYRSPCPKCDKVYMRSSELVNHTTLMHDRPFEFVCLHPSCSVTTYASPRFNKHHTESHPKCKMLQTDENGSSCRMKKPRVQPKKIWGCWLCEAYFTNVVEWAEHHMAHRGARESMSYTWLLRSLLSQDLVRPYWRDEITRQEESSQYARDLQWSAGKDQARDEVIEGLETGFWQGHGLDKDPQACRDIVASAMRASILGTKTKHGALAKTPGPRNNRKRPLSGSL
ncbi:hypothetical protein H2198_009591 [Neophaeococcomyces mojaviensis]|uniref:Uncharacterized protein n=1 Tax=Neophaeococcomyces mojaviensis TaxID=3383035 RepID=A0ACC2ZUJ6_9EURO|nr:hypothetical protein H2198_009591 [Knufia sp. JES_112]